VLTADKNYPYRHLDPAISNQVPDDCRNMPKPLRYRNLQMPM
jgi:hypothetical protein